MSVRISGKKPFSRFVSAQLLYPLWNSPECVWSGDCLPYILFATSLFVAVASRLMLLTECNTLNIFCRSKIKCLLVLKQQQPTEAGYVSMMIGHVSLAFEDEVGSTWEQEVNVLHVKRQDFV